MNVRGEFGKTWLERRYLGDTLYPACSASLISHLQNPAQNEEQALRLRDQHFNISRLKETRALEIPKEYWMSLFDFAGCRD